MERIRKLLRKFPLYRFAAGVAAGAPALALTFFLRMFGLGVFLPEQAVEFVVSLIPGSLEFLLIQAMGEGAKYLGLTTGILVFLALPGVYALFYRLVERWVGRRWLVLLIYALGPPALALFFILPLLGAGFLGSQTLVGSLAAVFSQLEAGFLFAALLDYFLVDFASRHPEGFQLSRRQFLAAVTGAVALGALALVGFGQFLTRSNRIAFQDVEALYDREITPNEDFYVVSKNTIDPVVDETDWDLSVEGLVGSPQTHTYPELLERMDYQEFVTFECVSNAVGGPLISTALWGGIPLAALLQEADPSAEADWVVFRCVDDYDVGIPRERAEDPATFLALTMNGVPLPTDHGYPARVVVPGIYGMFSAKWVEQIELVQGEHRGFWQRKGWVNSNLPGQGEIRTTAFLATPPGGSTVAGPVLLGGFAFSGDRGISRVEVSTDGGQTWEEAELKQPVLSPYTWVIWTYEWTPRVRGQHVIEVRAVDGEGVAQDPASEPAFPRGASGYDSVRLFAEPLSLASGRGR